MTMRARPAEPEDCFAPAPQATVVRWGLRFGGDTDDDERWAIGVCMPAGPMYRRCRAGWRRHEPTEQ